MGSSNYVRILLCSFFSLIKWFCLSCLFSYLSLADCFRCFRCVPKIVAACNGREHKRRTCVRVFFLWSLSSHLLLGMYLSYQLHFRMAKILLFCWWNFFSMVRVAKWSKIFPLVNRCCRFDLFAFENDKHGIVCEPPSHNKFSTRKTYNIFCFQ